MNSVNFFVFVIQKIDGVYRLGSTTTMPIFRRRPTTVHSTPPTPEPPSVHSSTAPSSSDSSEEDTDTHPADINDFHNALESLWDAVATLEPDTNIQPLKQVFNGLFHATGEMDTTDQHHPMTRFARCGSIADCQANLQAAVIEDTADLGVSSITNMMFDVPDTPCFNATMNVLRVWRAYTHTLMPDDSDSDSS